VRSQALVVFIHPNSRAKCCKVVYRDITLLQLTKAAGLTVLIYDKTLFTTHEPDVNESLLQVPYNCGNKKSVLLYLKMHSKHHWRLSGASITRSKTMSKEDSRI